MADSLHVPLRSKRQQRAQTVQKLNHAIPAFGLLLAGWQAVARGEAGFGFYLGVFEVAAAAALIVLTARELRTAVQSSSRFGRRRPAPEPHEQPAHHEHHGVDWVDIAAGFVLVAEVLEHWHTTGHISRPTVLTALITFAMGLSHGRVHSFVGRRRTLHVTDEGIDIPRRPFKARRLQASWADVQSIDVGPRWAVVTTRAGRVRKVDLHDVEHEREMRAALLEADRRKRLSEDPDAARR